MLGYGFHTIQSLLDHSIASHNVMKAQWRYKGYPISPRSLVMRNLWKFLLHKFHLNDSSQGIMTCLMECSSFEEWTRESEPTSRCPYRISIQTFMQRNWRHNHSKKWFRNGITNCCHCSIRSVWSGQPHIAQGCNMRIDSLMGKYPLWDHWRLWHECS